MGHHNRHYANDRYSTAGVWGRPTSTANFCEEDYAITLYVAEFINTLTNLAYVYLAFRYPHKGHKGASWRLDSMSIAMVILGINSFIFHATLQHTTQYCDELSMFILGGALLQSVFTINQTPSVITLMNTVIWMTIGVLSGIYIHTGDILHHVHSFNTMMLLIGLRTIYLIYFCGRSAQEKSRLMKMFGKAVGILIVGYTLWQVDLEKCFELREVRKMVGLPWAWLFELHGWWHVLTALGASEYIKLIRELIITS